MNNENRILYIDSYFAVVNKKPGELCERQSEAAVMPSAQNQTISSSAGEEQKSWYLPDIFADEIESRLGKKPEIIECVHRIDRPVSGAVVIALTQDSLRSLSTLFADVNSVHKKYIAIVEGSDLPVNPSKPLEYTQISSFILFNPSVKKAKIFDTEIRKSKKAVLEWRKFGSGERYSFLEIVLMTGRTHQIRAQLSHVGMHIKGDVKYGARRQDTIPGIRLHAQYISFKHPFTKNMVNISASILCMDPLWTACLESYRCLYK